MRQITKDKFSINLPPFFCLGATHSYLLKNKHFIEEKIHLLR